jgi:uracil-DNA glycosylase
VNVPPDGPIPARIMIVGEAPGADEERLGRPFVGMSGGELDRMLAEAQISRAECFVTNVCRVRPPGNDLSHFIAKTKKEITSDHTLIKGKHVKKPILEGLDLLEKELKLVKPNIVIALGNTSLWALTDKWGIQRWRGSMLSRLDGVKIIPTYHPAAILREWSWRAITVADLRRAAIYRDGRPYPTPNWRLKVRPTFQEVVAQLEWLIGQGPDLNLVLDIETSYGHIECFGLAWSAEEGLCIPLMMRNQAASYWTADEEGEIVWRLYRLLTQASIIGQNLLYDSQYIYRWWHFIPRVRFDTMTAHHVCFAGLPKKLDFQASMYSPYYVQWKKERGEWKEGG